MFQKQEVLLYLIHLNETAFDMDNHLTQRMYEKEVKICKLDKF